MALQVTPSAERESRQGRRAGYHPAKADWAWNGRGSGMAAASENLVAMVTGAGNGIGRAIVDRFLADGMRVVAVDVDAGALDRLTAELGTARVATAVADISVRDEVIAAVRLAVERYGR